MNIYTFKFVKPKSLFPIVGPDELTVEATTLFEAIMDLHIQFDSCFSSKADYFDRCLVNIVVTPKKEGTK